MLGRVLDDHCNLFFLLKSKTVKINLVIKSVKLLLVSSIFIQRCHCDLETTNT